MFFLIYTHCFTSGAYHRLLTLTKRNQRFFGFIYTLDMCFTLFNSHPSIYEGSSHVVKRGKRKEEEFTEKMLVWGWCTEWHFKNTLTTVIGVIGIYIKVLVLIYWIFWLTKYFTNQFLNVFKDELSTTNWGHYVYTNPVYTNFKYLRTTYLFIS